MGLCLLEMGARIKQQMGGDIRRGRFVGFTRDGSVRGGCCRAETETGGFDINEQKERWVVCN